jgi:hypothetical protein
MSIRAFKQMLNLAAKLPGGGAVYKFDLDTNGLIPKGSREGFKFFVTGEYASPVGGNSAIFCYSYYHADEWYLYNLSNGDTPKMLAVSVIAVPYGLHSDEYAETYFSHVATPANTRQQAGDEETSNEFQYITYLNEPALYTDLDESHELMLIVSRYMEFGDAMHDPMPDQHSFAVWFDPAMKKWAIVYPSRNSILPGTRFHVMAMKEYPPVRVYGVGEYPTAFAFEHAVEPSTIVSAINTSKLDKDKAERLLSLLPPELPKEPHQLVVIATERLDNNGLLLPAETWRGMRLKKNTEINLAGLIVWYINDGSITEGPLWSITKNSNEPIRPTAINICTRLPCPTYCGGT